MTSLKENVYDWKDRLKDRHMLTLVVTLIAIIVALGLYTYKKQRDYRQATENAYNMAFFELVDYVDSVASNVSDDLILYGDVIPDKIDRFRNMNIDVMNDIISKIDFNNISYIKCLGKEE